MSILDEKLVQYFNEALAMENAAVDRIKSRMGETPIEQTRQQLQYHLEQTVQQQKRLSDIITGLGGSPTSMKAALPKIMPLTPDTASNTTKRAAKSMANLDDKASADADKELLSTKEDAIIESAEVVSYKMLMEIAERAGKKDLIPPLKQSLQEETAMVNFIMGNAPLVLRLMLAKLEAPGKAAQA